MHSNEVHDLYCSLNIIQVTKQERGDGLRMYHVWERGRNIQGFGGETRDKQATWKT